MRNGGKPEQRRRFAGAKNMSEQTLLNLPLAEENDKALIRKQEIGPFCRSLTVSFTNAIEAEV